MNWIKQLKTILGRFWHVVFQELDLIFGLELFESLYAQIIEHRHTNWFAGLIAKNIGVKPNQLPFVIYIPKAAVNQIGATLDQVITSGTLTFIEPVDTNGYAAPVLNETPVPTLIQDHVVRYTQAWINGPDFSYEDRVISFKAATALSELGLPEVIKTDPETGESVLCYRLFGWRMRTDRTSDAVQGLVDADLVPFADVVWEMHQMGVTPYLAKKLLAETAGAVVADNSGTVIDIWSEQDNTLNCIQIDDRVYCSHSEFASDFEEADVIPKGTVLFGTIKFPSDTDTPSQTDVPGITVMTDAGICTAENKDAAAIEYSEEVGEETVVHGLILPLAGDNAANYQERCKQLIDDPACPVISDAIPSTVNAYDYITKTVRRNKDLVCVVDDPPSVFYKAVECIKKHMHSGAVLSVYVKAEAEAATRVLGSVLGSPTADTESSPVTIINGSAEADLI